MIKGEILNRIRRPVMAAKGAQSGTDPFARLLLTVREWPAGRHWGVTRQALLLDVKQALVDEFVDAEGA